MDDGILNTMKPMIFIAGLLFVSQVMAESVTTVIGPEFWMSPRQGETLIKSEPLAGVVRAYLDATGDAKLRIRYPATETGELWGEELQAWLVSLGIASDRIEVISGYDHDDAVEVSLLTVSAVDGQAKDVKQNGKTK